MALLETPQASQGIFKAVKDAFGLFGNTNKVAGNVDNTEDQPLDEFESSMTEMEILELTAQWRQLYAPYYQDIEKTQKLAFNYWIGKHAPPDSTGNLTGITLPNEVGITDNVLFKAIETFLPLATRANPEPLVQADNSDIGRRIAKDIQTALVSEADRQLLRRKLAKTTRQWLLNRLGCVKVVWDSETKQIDTLVINPRKIILDPDGHINERGEFEGDWLGEMKQDTAEKIIELFPKKEKEILFKAKGKKGTLLKYIEWWYCGTDVFYTMDQDLVLGKFKNPNWNYDGEVKDTNPLTGEETTTFVQGKNHLLKPSYPHLFLSVFSTDTQPHDDTSLVLQNIAQQDKINRREVQIDRNVENMNNGIVVSGEAFTEDQAAGAASALRRGIAIRVPNGDVGKSVAFPERPPLPRDVFQNLEDARAQLEAVFGISGSTPEGMDNEDTVRGKILVNQMDGSRIGGGITEYIEQLADSIYNYWVQMMFVYYDEPHYLTAAGSIEGGELTALTNANFPLLKTLNITVKEGSLIPKDPLTKRNEAMDLWSANAIDPFTLFKRLDDPDPAASTQLLILWQMLQKGQIQPQMYLPSFNVQGMGAPGGSLPTEQPGTGGPAVNPPPPNGDINAQTPPPTPESMQAESQQLIGQVPLNGQA